MMNRYIVTAKCGHVTRRYYIPISFPILARNAKEAAKIARNIPRVKRDHKDAILSVRKVDELEYNNQVFLNNQDPYLLCCCNKDQGMINSLENRLCDDPHFKLKVKRGKPNNYSVKKNRILTNECLNEISEYYLN